MDRSRVLQQLQESQARLAKAEAELAEAAGKLRAWSEAGNHGPLDTSGREMLHDGHLYQTLEGGFGWGVSVVWGQWVLG